MKEPAGAEDDATLVRRALAGGAEAFGGIVRRYQDAVFAVALARLGDFHEAEDVTQNVLVEGYQRLESLKDPRRLGAWLRSMAIHKAIDVVRRRQASPVARAEEIGQQVAARRERRHELHEEVMAAVGRLSQTQRETTTLFYINGYSMQEVAGIQEVPLGTVKRRLHEARARLKQEMMTMVEGVLKSEAPDDNASRRVYELLTARGEDGRLANVRQWWQTAGELTRIGEAGFDGFRGVMGSAHSPTRVWAMNLLGGLAKSGLDVEHLAVGGLKDPNRKVRRFALTVLENTRESRLVKQKGYVRLVLPLLGDASRRVRRAAAWTLAPWAQHVPVKAAVEALAREQDRKTAERMRILVKEILRVQGADATN
ncbi:MAG: sigma-70 family RNA polymerase sigma factor [Phycisphaeraceae bacterium]|nr:sigma-70 family RNA polymerase sigma factor [Phycisphaeraceae bacterium]